MNQRILWRRREGGTSASATREVAALGAVGEVTGGGFRGRVGREGAGVWQRAGVKVALEWQRGGSDDPYFYDSLYE